MVEILVTGGCGFIGTNFIHYLIRHDPNVRITNLDKLTYAGNLENLASLEGHPRYRFIKGDIADKAAVGQAFSQRVDVVINFAAESHVDRSILDSSPFVRTNILGTQHLLDAAKTAGVQKFVQISTDEVYGSLGKEGYFTEATPLAPNSPYAASKAAADLLVRSYVNTFGLPAVITRCSNNYGPYQFPEKLIPLFISNLCHDRPVPLYGDGSNVRDWIYVEDHCRAIDLVWRRGVPGEIYNIGGRCEKSNLELTRTLLELLGKPESLIRFVADRPGHDHRYAVDCSKIERELGWKPVVSFDEGITRTIAWYRNHAGWLERIRTQEYLSYYETQYRQRLAEGWAA